MKDEKSQLIKATFKTLLKKLPSPLLLRNLSNINSNNQDYTIFTSVTPATCRQQPATSVLDVNVDQYDSFLVCPSVDHDVREKKRRRDLRKMLMENKSMMYSPNDNCEIESPATDPTTY